MHSITKSMRPGLSECAPGAAIPDSIARECDRCVRDPQAPGLLVVASDARACTEIVRVCAALEHVRLLKDFCSGAAAIEAAEALQPCLVLLDTPLTDMSEKEFLCQLPECCCHAVVFIIANAGSIPVYLETGAAECLARPISASTLSMTLTRARARSRTKVREPREQRGRRFGGEALPPIVLVGEREHRLYPLDPYRIDYIASADNYVKFWIGRTQYIARDTIKRLYPLLRPLGFLRIERSILVNLSAVAYIQPFGRGAFVFELTSGQRLRSSGGYSERILDTLPLRRRESIRGGGRRHPSVDDDDLQLSFAPKTPVPGKP